MACMMAYCVYMMCMHDGMLEAIDMLEMLCTLNLTQFTPHTNVGSERNKI